MPAAALPKAIRDEVERLGTADIMVGIPSFKNAATIGYVARAAQAGLVQYFPDLRPVLVNADAGSTDGTQRVVVETEPPGLHRAHSPRPTHEQASAHLADVSRGRRRRRQGRGIAHDLPDRGRAQGRGPGRGRFGPALDRARVDRAPGRTDPEGRLRFRRPALLALQVRRDYHQHGHVSHDTGAVRAAHPPADWRRLRRQRRPRSPLPGAGRLGCRHLEVRCRHLDDDQGDHGRLRRMPDPTWRQGARSKGSGGGPGSHVLASRRDAACA